MKLSVLLIVLLAVCLTQQNNFVRNQHTTTQNHQIFQNSWFGTSSSACDTACTARNFNVCGRFKKQCCKQACTDNWWGYSCDDDYIVQDLDCSVLQSVTGKYWTGTTCNSQCTSVGGTVCGKTNKQCCETGCDSGILLQTCKDSKSKQFNCTATSN